MLGKVIGSGLDTSSIINNDAFGIDKFVKDFRKSEMSISDFLSGTKEIDPSVRKAAAGMSDAAISSDALAKAVGKATLKTKLLNTAMVALKAAAIIAVIYAIGKAWDKANVTIEEQTEKVDKLKEAYGKLKDEYKELLEKDDLSTSEKQRLDYLQRRLELDEKILEVEQKQLDKKEIGTSFFDFFRKDSLSAALSKESSVDNTGMGELFGSGNSYNDLKTGLFTSEMDLKRTRTDIKEMQKYRSTLTRDSIEYEGIQGRINDLTKEETKILEGMGSTYDSLIVKQGELLSYSQRAQEVIDRGFLDGEDLEQAENTRDLFRQMYLDAVAATTRIQIARGEYDDRNDQLGRKFGGISQDDLNSLSGEDKEIALKFSPNNEIGFEKLKEMIAETKNEVYEFNETDVSTFSTSDMIQQLSSLESSISSVDSAYSNFLDEETGGKFDISDLEAIRKEFEGLEGVNLDVLNRSLDALGSPSSSIEDVNNALSALSNELVLSSGVLDNVTESTKDMVVAQLEEMGIVNAEQLVMQRLTMSVEGAELATKEYALAKLTAGGTALTTSMDIKNIADLVSALGGACDALEKYATLKEKISKSQLVLDDASSTSSQKKAALELLKRNNKALKSAETDAKKEITDAINGNTKDYDSAIFGGGASTKKATEKNAKSAKDEYSDLFDWFELRIKNLQDAISRINAEYENVVGSFQKNRLVDAEYGLTKSQLDENNQMLSQYSAKAQELLTKIPESLRGAAQNGGIAITDIVGDGNKEVIDAVNNYRELADKVAATKIEVAELTTKLRELAKLKFDNIAQDFQEEFDIVKNTIDLIQAQVDLVDSSGNFVGKGYFNELINQATKQLGILESKRSSLAQELSSALSSGQIQAGTDEWIEMVSTLQELDSEIVGCKNDVEEFNNSIQELHWEVFDKVIEQYDNIHTELQNIIDVLDTDNLFNNDGSFTSEGLANLGLLAQQYETASLQSRQYAKEIDELNKAYSEGKYTALEYAEKLAELNQAQWDSIDASEAAKDAIYDLAKARVDKAIEAIEEEKDAYKEHTEALIKNLEAQKDLHDFQKSLSEKTKSVTDIQKQLASMVNDDTAETVAKRKKLENDLAGAQSDLDDFIYDHDIEAQKEALNKNLADYEAEKDKETEALNKSLEDKEKIIAEFLDTVKNNTIIISAELTKIAEEYGIDISDTITNAWKNGENAISAYGDTLAIEGSAFQSELLKTQNSIYLLAEESNRSSIALANMYATSGANLMNTLLAGRSSLENTTYASNVLHDSLSGALSGAYDASGIIGALNSIRDAANAAASAISNMNNASGGKFKVISKNGNTIADGFSSKGDAEEWLRKYGLWGTYSSGNMSVSAYAKGGVVKKNRQYIPLDEIANAVGEDTMIAVKHGEGILDKEQTGAIIDMKEYLPELGTFMRGMTSGNISTPALNGNAGNIVVDSSITVNGNIDDTNIAKMQKVAEKAVRQGFKELKTQWTFAGK